MGERRALRDGHDGPIANWDTHLITDMSSLFSGKSTFNYDVSSWNTSSVTTMQATFYQASAFNQPIGMWNIDSVTDVSFMFRDASAFNQYLCWDFSESVTTVSMFTNSPGSADCPPTSSPTTPAPTPASYTFTSKTELQTAVNLWVSDEPRGTRRPISDWGTPHHGHGSAFLPQGHSTMTSARGVRLSHDHVSNFQGRVGFNQPIGTWNTRRRHHASMFYEARRSTSPSARGTRARSRTWPTRSCTPRRSTRSSTCGTSTRSPLELMFSPLVVRPVPVLGRLQSANTDNMFQNSPGRRCPPTAARRRRFRR